MKINAVRADFAQQIANLHRRQLLAHRPAERIAAGVADRPQAKREFQFRIGFVVAWPYS